MAPKKKAIKSAPASKEPVRRKDGKPTRAEKSKANKAVHKAVTESAKELAVTVIAKQKHVGQVVAAQYRTSADVAKLIGQPVEWTDELGTALFALIATGHSMEEISKTEGMPSLYQLLRWLGEETHPFVKVRTRAKEMLIPLYEEQAQRIAVASNKLSIITKKQVLTKDGDIENLVEEKIVDNVDRSRLALQGLQWTLSHLAPKKHGRNPDGFTGKNEQLEGLFAALKTGPVE